MPDGFIALRRGEKRPVYAQAALSSGTLTIAASPTPTATLYAANGTAVGGFAGLSATGYDTGAQTAPRVWLNLDATALNAGFYVLAFSFTAAGADGLTRTYVPTVEVQVRDITD